MIKANIKKGNISFEIDKENLSKKEFKVVEKALKKCFKKLEKKENPEEWMLMALFAAAPFLEREDTYDGFNFFIPVDLSSGEKNMSYKELFKEYIFYTIESYFI